MSVPWPTTPAYYQTNPKLGEGEKPIPHPALLMLSPMAAAATDNENAKMSLSEMEADLPKYFTEDFVKVSPDGTETEGLEAAYRALKRDQFSFDFYTKMRNQAGSLVIVPDGEGGYELFGTFVSCYEVKEEYKKAAKGFVDDQGTNWDLGVPGAVRVRFRDIGNGEIRLSRHQSFADKSVIKALIE